jgi:hypothetical protein
MAERNNLYPITGIVYDKPVKKVLAKKGPNAGKEVEIPSIVLEIRGNGNGIDYVELVEFSIGNRSIPLEDFCIKDPVEIVFALAGIKGTKGYFTKAKAIYIKHTDVSYNDTTDLRAEKPGKKEKEVFVGAVPPNPSDDPDESDLPF